MSAVIVCASKAVAPPGSSTTLTWSDVRRACCADAAAQDQTGGLQRVVQVQLLVEFAIRRLRYAVASDTMPRLSQAECSALSGEFTLLRLVSNDEPSKCALVSSTPLQAFSLDSWTGVPLHTFLLVPLADVVGRAASEAIRNVFSTPGRHHLSNIGQSTSMRRTQNRDSSHQHSAPNAAGAAASTSDAPADVAVNLNIRLSSGAEALLEIPQVAMPQQVTSSIAVRDLDLINEGIRRNIVLVPESIKYMLCPGCHKLQLSVLQMQCCGACQCPLCSALPTCCVCGEEAREVDPPMAYPDRSARALELAKELLVMFRAEIAAADRSSRGVLSNDSVLAAPALPRPPQSLLR